MQYKAPTFRLVSSCTTSIRCNNAGLHFDKSSFLFQCMVDKTVPPITRKEGRQIRIVEEKEKIIARKFDR